jgi:hypothetical protein
LQLVFLQLLYKGLDTRDVVLDLGCEVAVHFGQLVGPLLEVLLDLVDSHAYIQFFFLDETLPLVVVVSLG